jgi:6-phosphogluconate dehydrogenase
MVGVARRAILRANNKERNMQMGMVGLGRMGQNMVWRLAKAGHEVVVTDRDPEVIRKTVAIESDVHTISADVIKGIKQGMEKSGGKIVPAATPDELVAKLKGPRAVWLMIPAGITEKVATIYAEKLQKGDALIDGGNSYYIDDIRRSKELKAKGIDYIDVGTSGGVWGLMRGYCLMIGGDKGAVERLGPIFKAIAPGQGDVPPTKTQKILRAEEDKDGHVKPIKGEMVTASGTSADSYLHCGPSGAGHFVKMVHNGMEYGIMAAYAEGLNILKHANVGKTDRKADSAEVTPLREPEHYQYDFDLQAICENWRRGSVIASWLLDLTAEAFLENPALPVEEMTLAKHGVPDSGEGRWTLLAAIDESVPSPVLSASLYSRFASRHEEDFAWKIVQAMRRKFGGH